MDFPCSVIHRSQDTNRDELVANLKTLLPQLQVFEAIQGSRQMRIPRRHPYAGQLMSDGNIGCTLSHIKLLDSMLENNLPVMGIFEDDAVLTVEPEILVDFYKQFKNQDWDILYLGVSEVKDGDYVDTDFEITSYYKIRSSWGTHSVLVRPSGANAILKTFHRCLQEGYMYPADHLYNRAIVDCSLKAIGPPSPYFIQKPGLVSTCTGKVR